MADTDLKDIFEQAAGGPDKTDQLKHDDKDMKDIFQEAHDQQDPIEQVASEKAPSKLESYGTMAAKGATAGLTGTAAGVGAALGGASEGQYDWPTMKKNYQEALEAQKSKEEAAKEQTGLGGQAVEFAAGIPAMVVGGGALEGAGVASKIGQAAGVGAGAGLANYVGQTADPTALGAAGNTAIGAGLGAIGGKIGEKLEGALNPEDLQTTSSKLAQEAMGMNSAKDLTSRYNPVTQQMEKGSDIIKGTGTTALNQDVLKGGPGKWFDNALTSLNKNYSDLSSTLQSTQSKLTPNLANIMEDVGPITTKTPDIMQDVFDSIPQSSQKNLIIRKINNGYQQYEQKLAQADGNLPALNAIKQELTSAAEALSPQIYANGTAKTEADLYKRMAGVVRQHIEDLASAADPGAGDSIHSINQNIGNITSTIPALKQLTRGGIPTSGKDLAQKVVGPIEGFAARALNHASNIETKSGVLVQKAIPATPNAIISNPFTQEKLRGKNTSNPSEATNTSSSLYNATDDSLKQVASKFNETPGLQFYADHLNKAIDTNDSGEKNRAIFLIMQNPKARQLIMPDSGK